MSDSLGLSIGVAHLVAARAGRPPVIRSPVVTLFEHRPTEVGLPEENPNLTQPGLVLRGFVERVGDQTPLVAADGTKYLGRALTVEAIEAMARSVGYGAPVTIAIPAYWTEAQAAALREEFFAQPDLTRSGAPPALVSDAVAALTALRTQQGFPSGGVVALCDFGASGASITLFDAGSAVRQIGPSARDTAFSGDALDQLVLAAVNASTMADGTAAIDLTGTARLASQGRLLGECKRAKELLSTAASAVIGTGAGTGTGEDFQLSRNEFEQLVAEPLDRFLGFVDAVVDEALRRNGIPNATLAAMAAVGGAAGIPLVGATLARHFGVPVHTMLRPAFSAAIGAAMLGDERASAATLTAASPMVQTPTEMAPALATEMAPALPTEMAAAVPPTQIVPGAGPEPALAWSEDTDDSAEPVPYTGPDMTGEYAGEAGAAEGPGEPVGPDDGSYGGSVGLPWYKRTALVLSLVSAAAAVIVAGLLALTVSTQETTPVDTTSPKQPPPPTSVTMSTSPPETSPPTTAPAPPPPPTPTPTPEPTTTNPPTTTTTTTQPPTTTTTTTTTTAPTTTTTTTAPTTTTTPPTTTAPTTTPTTTPTPTPTTTPTKTHPRPLFPRFQSPFLR